MLHWIGVTKKTVNLFPVGFGEQMGCGEKRKRNKKNRADTHTYVRAGKVIRTMSSRRNKFSIPLVDISTTHVSPNTAPWKRVGISLPRKSKIHGKAPS